MKILKNIFIITSLLCLLTSCGNNQGDSNSPPSSKVMTEIPAATESIQAVMTVESPMPTDVTETPVPVILYFEDFEDTASGWERYHEYDGILDYEDGAYRMKVDATNNLFWVKAMNPEPFDHALIQVKTILLESQQDAPYGIICRLDENNQYYYFFITGDGHFGIGKHLTNPSLQQILLADDGGQTSTVINLGLNATNTIRVGCNENHLSLFVNDVRLLEAYDDQLQSGNLALLAGVQDSPGIDVLFDDFTVMEP